MEREANRANWDERVGVHLGPGGYDLSALRAGRGHLHEIEENELGDVRGLRVLHLQCHFGCDSLTLAQRGAEVVGLDFSRSAIEAARKLAAELGLTARARFVEADLYEAPTAVAEPASFDRVFVTLGDDHLATRHCALGSCRRAFPQARRLALPCRRSSGRSMTWRPRRAACRDILHPISVASRS